MTRISRFTSAYALAALGAIAAAAAGCGGSNNTTTVTAPTGTLVTETFTGTLNPPTSPGVFQTNVHPFTVTTGGGTINVTLVSAGPPSTIQLGLGLGNPSSTGGCSFIPGFVNSQAVASSTAQISGTGAPAGAYCIAVGDVGNVLQPVSYTVTVAHT